MRDRQKEDISHTDAQEIYLYDAEDNQKTHTNILTDDYLEYINSIDPDICDNIGYIALLYHMLAIFNKIRIIHFLQKI